MRNINIIEVGNSKVRMDNFIVTNLEGDTPFQVGQNLFEYEKGREEEDMLEIIRDDLSDYLSDKFKTEVKGNFPDLQIDRLDEIWCMEDFLEVLHTPNSIEIHKETCYFRRDIRRIGLSIGSETFESLRKSLCK